MNMFHADLKMNTFHADLLKKLVGIRRRKVDFLEMEHPGSETKSKFCVSAVPSPSLHRSLLQDVSCSLALWTPQPASKQENVLSSYWLAFLLLALSLI